MRSSQIAAPLVAFFGLSTGLLLGGVAAPPAEAAKSCGDRPALFAYNIKVNKTGCGKVKKIIKKWNKTERELMRKVREQIDRAAEGDDPDASAEIVRILDR
jgi:hypothetical protein